MILRIFCYASWKCVIIIHSSQPSYDIVLFFIDFSCMATIEVDIVYNQIVRGTIMKRQKVDDRLRKL